MGDGSASGAVPGNSACGAFHGGSTLPTSCLGERCAVCLHLKGWELGPRESKWLAHDNRRWWSWDRKSCVLAGHPASPPALLSSCDGYTSFRLLSIFCSIPHKSRALSHSSPCWLIGCHAWSEFRGKNRCRFSLPSSRRDTALPQILLGDLALSFSSEALKGGSPVGCIQRSCWREFRICRSFGAKVCTLDVTLHEVTREVSLGQDRAAGLHRPTLPRHYSPGPQGFLIGDGAWGHLEVIVA